MTETNDKKWKGTGLGDLPPMVHLDIGDTVTGVVEDVRDVKRKGSKKEKMQIGIHIRVTDSSTVSTGSVKKKTKKRVTYDVGNRVCITVGGNLSTLLRDLAMKEAGLDLSSKTTEELKAEDFKQVLKGREIRVQRLDDGEIQTGEFKGNAVKRFTLDYTDPISA